MGENQTNQQQTKQKHNNKTNKKQHHHTKLKTRLNLRVQVRQTQTILLFCKKRLELLYIRTIQTQSCKKKFTVSALGQPKATSPASAGIAVFLAQAQYKVTRATQNVIISFPPMLRTRGVIHHTCIGHNCH